MVDFSVFEKKGRRLDDSNFLREEFGFHPPNRRITIEEKKIYRRKPDLDIVTINGVPVTYKGNRIVRGRDHFKLPKGYIHETTYRRLKKYKIIK